MFVTLIPTSEGLMLFKDGDYHSTVTNARLTNVRFLLADDSAENAPAWVQGTLVDTDLGATEVRLLPYQGWRVEYYPKRHVWACGPEGKPWFKAKSALVSAIGAAILKTTQTQED